ncbi:polyglutamine-binding protein 1 isoform X2 [Zootermopsis nevadensis]|uniref:polyglutamine-binding protein 1 isoform X2 n=1 Tax=Zootermopsis nevadensis TaxID=136037 RepID=UPI000B8E98DC|nr:polyglutamine-binding protein 1 isoform X2 [Zootermopsis nevadensis]
MMYTTLYSYVQDKSIISVVTTAAPVVTLPANSEEEEVIAEDYDNQKKDTINNNVNDSDYVDDFMGNLEKKLMGYSGCPNKYNIYHECTAYCEEKWEQGFVEPDSVYMRKKQRMLLKYPLPENWVEVYDPGTGRYYYWHTESDAVSWLSPRHPRAVISESAAHIREEMHMAEVDDDDEDDEEEDDDKESDMDDDGEASDEDSREEKRREEQERRREARERHRAKGRTKVRDNDIDPMDPAAYSDTPRGTWSTGLGKKNEAKTGADTTAAGPLYQMRPYPSPGAVLRANAKSKPHSEKTKMHPELPPK